MGAVQLIWSYWQLILFKLSPCFISEWYVRDKQLSFRWWFSKSSYCISYYLSCLGASIYLFINMYILKTSLWVQFNLVEPGKGHENLFGVNISYATALILTIFKFWYLTEKNIDANQNVMTSSKRKSWEVALP